MPGVDIHSPAQGRLLCGATSSVPHSPNKKRFPHVAAPNNLRSPQYRGCTALPGLSRPNEEDPRQPATKGKGLY